MTSPLGGPARILVVDDDPTIGELVRLILTEAGFNVTLVGSGEEGFAQATLNLPQLVISDVVLPGIDGYTLCRKLRSTASACDLRILLLTARTEMADRIGQLRIGPDEYLPKPFSPQDLLVMVERLLELTNRLSKPLRLDCQDSGEWIKDIAPASIH